MFKTVKLIILSMLTIFFSSTMTFAKENIVLTTSIDNVSNNITNTFKYKIEPIEYTGAENEPKEITASFYSVKPNNHNVTIKNYIDFSNTLFPNLGVYEYYVSEISSDDSITFPTSNQKYKIIVEVSLDKDNNKIKKVFSQAIDLDNNEKTDLTFSHSGRYSFITIENSVNGKMTSENDYFKYEVSIFGNIDDEYIINGQDETVYFEGKKINTTKVCKVRDKKCYIYLKGNQTVTIGKNGDILQIPIGAKYTITMIDTRKIDTKINGKDISKVDYLITDKGDNVISIDNNIEFVTVRWIFINIFPYIILISLSIIGIILIIKTRKKMMIS